MKGWPLGEAMEKVKIQTENAWSDYRNHGDDPAGDWDGANAAAAAWQNPYRAVPDRPVYWRRPTKGPAYLQLLL